jgi:hypothetical protein
VVKEADSKSAGLCPREFKSRRCRQLFATKVLEDPALVMAKWQGNRFVSGRSGVRTPLPAVVFGLPAHAPAKMCGVGFESHARQSRVYTGRIAQSVERWSNKPLVMGSIPIVTTFCFSKNFHTPTTS